MIGKGHFRIWVVASVAWVAVSGFVLFGDRLTPKPGDDFLSGVPPVNMAAHQAATDTCFHLQHFAPRDPRMAAIANGSQASEAEMREFQSLMKKWEDEKPQRDQQYAECSNRAYQANWDSMRRKLEADTRQEVMRGLAITLLPPVLVAIVVIAGVGIAGWVRAGYDADRQA